MEDPPRISTSISLHLSSGCRQMYSLFHLSSSPQNIFAKLFRALSCRRRNPQKSPLSPLSVLSRCLGHWACCLSQGLKLQSRKNKGRYLKTSSSPFDLGPSSTWMPFPKHRGSPFVAALSRQILFCSRESTICFQALWPKQHSSASGTRITFMIFPISPY